LQRGTTFPKRVRGELSEDVVDGDGGHGKLGSIRGCGTRFHWGGRWQSGRGLPRRGHPVFSGGDRFDLP
jgi:hypothetical protein